MTSCGDHCRQRRHRANEATCQPICRPVPARNRPIGQVGYRPSGQKCYVAFVPARTPRVKASDDADQATMLSPAQVAEKLGIEERTVRRWAAADVLPAEHTRTGHHRLPASLVPALQQLIRDKVPLNARTLRGRFEQFAQLQEDRQPTD
jgi:excisionase family DNA binding protein